MRTVITLCVCLLTIPALLAQDSLRSCHLQFSAGLSFLSVGDQSVRYNFQPLNRPVYEIQTRNEYRSFLTVVVHPKINLVQFKKRGMGLNLSFPLSISAFGETSTANSPIVYKNRNYLLANLPFLLELALGQKAWCKCANKSRTGGFVSLGGSLIYGTGKVGEFKSVVPYGMIGIRKGIGIFTGELSAGSSLLTAHRIPGTVTETNFTPLTSYTGKKIGHAISFSLYFK